MHVVMVDINTKLLETSAQEVKSISGAGDVTPITTDVSKFDEVIKLKEKVLDLHGEIAILMNNVRVLLAYASVFCFRLTVDVPLAQAALLTKTAPAFSLTEPVANVHQTWEDIMSVNFGGVLNGTQVFAPVM
jgi:NAD(P)-dependent dehydrogenase (short-subunit alcohol dehydrogenase family)